jgi:hypothetical protein
MLTRRTGFGLKNIKNSAICILSLLNIPLRAIRPAERTKYPLIPMSSIDTF